MRSHKTLVDFRVYICVRVHHEHSALLFHHDPNPTDFADHPSRTDCLTPTFTATRPLLPEGWNGLACI